MMVPYNKNTFDKVMAIASNNIEQFRYEATVAHTAYTKPQRQSLRPIRHIALFYTQYHEVFQPTVKALSQKKPFDTIKADLVKGLIIGQTVADSLTQKLYHERHENLIRETVAPLSRRSKRHASRLLRLPTEQVNSLLEAYGNDALYHDVARQLRISTYDPHDSLIARALVMWRIYRHRRQMLRHDHKRISTIDRELQKVDTEKGNLLRRIVDSDIELVVILALRNEFTKKLMTSRRQNSRDQLDKFEKVTKKFITQQLDLYLEQYPTAILQDVAHKKRTLEQLLQDIFALDNTERNQLLLAFSDYSRLYSERSAILAAQRARDEYIKRR